MDLDEQRIIQQIVTHQGNENVIVVLGAADPEGVELTAMTVTTGDPTFAGPLAGVPLGLPTFHILESAIRDQIPDYMFQTHLAMMDLVIDSHQIESVLKRVRYEAGIADE